MKDVSKLWSAGYALGATSTIRWWSSEDRVLNADGLRYPDEFVRHKALDALGDLALAGAPLLGDLPFGARRPQLNHAMLSALMADPTAWTMVEAGDPRPAPRRVRGHAGVTGRGPRRLPDRSRTFALST